MKLCWNILNSSLVLVWLVSCVLAGVVGDGTDDRMTTGIASSTFFNSTGATISIWIKPTGSAPAVSHLYEGQSILGDDNGAGSYYGIYRHNNSGAGDEVNCWSYLSNSEEVATATDNNTWTHIAYVQDNASLTCYKNGVSAGSNTNSTAMDTTNAGNFNVLDVNQPGVTTVYAGEVADIRLYNTALTAAQVEVIAKSRMHYVGAMNGSAYWTFAQCSDGAAANGVGFVDVTGNGRTLTADDGANNTGMTCTGASAIGWPVGAN